MSRDKFTHTLGCMHFADTDNHPENYRLENLTCFKQSTLQILSVFALFWKLCINESLFKERLRFEQFMPPKHFQFQINYILLCDCKALIIFNLFYDSSPQNVQQNYPTAAFKNFREMCKTKNGLLCGDNLCTISKLFGFICTKIL